ncbi:hypothetical protein HLK59_13805 [Streptomyces sp. S3(2020)]|uniref:hypothetical protein n=1 Tax=Streptomyces sp. S3(2020) TaxID=2732044 RepID=UPI0014891046|nr:hypothetical protein [Streptomyces sp. S3(2020)]NNN31420.1 hypothetical protein [Streptomyces sp. S3(2020)]
MALIKRDAKAGLIALAQQSVCAFDLIGLKLLGRTSEVDALRTVRDEALAKTEAGREWITLIERIELPIAPLLLDDERLAAKAGKLLARAGQLVTDTKEQVGDGEVDLGLDLLRDLDTRGGADSSDLRADLKAVSALLERLRGLSSPEVLKHLTSRGPRNTA